MYAYKGVCVRAYALNTCIREFFVVVVVVCVCVRARALSYGVGTKLAVFWEKGSRKSLTSYSVTTG